jgi:hypothetical protein
VSRGDGDRERHEGAAQFEGDCMSTTIRCLLVVAGLVILCFLSTSVTVHAQQIETGNGVVCDSPQLVERFIALRIETQKAIEQINAQSSSGSCEFLVSSYIVGGIVGEASNADGTWEIRKILIVGLIIGRTRKPLLAYQKFTAFIISKAPPL